MTNISRSSKIQSPQYGVTNISLEQSDASDDVQSNAPESNQNQWSIQRSIHKITKKSAKAIHLIVIDFRNFLLHGNVFDLAIGIIMGSAFTNM